MLSILPFRRSWITAASLALLPACGGPAKAPKQSLGVGDVAPPFSVRTVTRDGAPSAPVTLESLHGKTVVLAFFPKAHTPGCTTQMKAYRDRYASLFNGGKDVVLLAISTDDEATLGAWAKEEQFPFAFVSDPDGKLGAQFGAMDEGDWFADRVLYVISPEGRITYKASPFRQSSEAAYVSLDSAVDQVATR